jgi:hypothetical protein
VTRLHIHTPPGVVSTAELKDWAISWSRSDKLWVKPPDDDDCDDDRSLSLHRFNMRQDDDDTEPNRFMMANLISGGEFVVVIYTDGNIDLKKIEISPGDEWNLRDVAQYKQRDPDEIYPMFCSQLITETNLGHPLVAYVDRGQEKYGHSFSESSAPPKLINAYSLFVFLVDHIVGTIEQKQVVKLDGTYFYEVYGIHARGGIILCFYEHGHGWGITVSELGPDPALKHFTLNANRVSRPFAHPLLKFTRGVEPGTWEYSILHGV